MTSKLSPTRFGLVEGRDVFVFDGLIPDTDLAQYVDSLEKSLFSRTEVADLDRPDRGLRHWICELPLPNLAQLPIWAATERAVACARPGEQYRPNRAYTNYASYGDVLYTHTDCLPHKRGLTALWFLSTEWDPEWGGETMFFDASSDAMFCVSPKPGRLVVFDGAIPHAGRPPTRICYKPRYTFAIKLEAVPAG